jgi:hypothetical protein
MLRRGLYLAMGAIPASWLSAELLLALLETSQEMADYLQYSAGGGQPGWLALSMPAWPALIGTLALWSTVIEPRARPGSLLFLLTSVGLLIGLMQILPLSLINLGESLGEEQLNGVVSTFWFFLGPPLVALDYIFRRMVMISHRKKDIEKG